jgi:hypothetical protein
MMEGTVHYGQAKSEKLAEESKIARQIVREIGNFGVNDRQRLLIMYYLGLELEKVEDMRSVTEFITKQVGEDLFIASNEESTHG